MGEPPLVDIRPDHWEIVREILHKYVPDREVWAFGSRARWTAKQYSDLDLAVLGDEPLDLDIQAGMEEDFSESDLPFKVDVVDWATTAETFREIVEKDRVVVQRGGQRTITQLLGALDDKIEWNRRMNADLEAMARALFKDWFVDFGPVRAKVEGRPAYLAPEIWELFPGALDGEERPVGWTERPITSFFSMVGGETPRRSFSTITRQIFEETTFVYASDGVFKAFEEMVHPQCAMIEANTTESRTLTQLRDLLLSRLIN
ncbi:MAG: nucleotidyltransferase domain-containing protein [Magnetococcus sp. MYC-9]